MAPSDLVLTGERKHNFAGWFARVQQFYISLAEVARLQGPLACFSTTPDASVEAQTQAQTVLEALSAWTRDFTGNPARVAFDFAPRKLNNPYVD